MSKVVIITGSSSGFGELATRSLSSEGYTVYATMRNANGKNASKAKELEALAGVTVLDLDVTNDASTKKAVDTVIAKEGKVDVLVNNAGIGSGGFTEPYSADEFQKVFNVNVFGVQRMMNAVLPNMRKNRTGLVINISSTMGRIVLPFAGAYTASKYALEGLSESYRYELAPTGVDVTVIEPGGFGTNFFSGMMAASDAERISSYGELNNIPEQMWGGVGQMLQDKDAPNPQDVADAIVNLIKTPAGQRPLRTVVDPMMGGEAPTAINATTDQIQGQVLEGLQMGELSSVS